MAGSNETAPYYDREAEASIVGSIIDEPSLLEQIDLDSTDFFMKDHQLLFEAILRLRERQEEINQGTVIKEVAGKVDSWVVGRVISDSLPDDCLKHAAKVKELSRQRRLLGAIDQSVRKFYKNHLTSHELVDSMMMALSSLDLHSKVSRSITITNPRIIQAQPPTYKLSVSGRNGSSPVDIKFSSADLDNPAAFRRHIREHLQINPVLPKPFDAYIHNILQNAIVEEGQEDASFEDSVCYWIGEWFSMATEAENYYDLSQGYITKDSARWFPVERLLRFVSERGKVKIDRSGLWAVISDRGGRKGKVIRLGEKTVRLWGLDESFFAQHAVAEDEQIPLAEDEEDLRWSDSE